jgi:hypothetical protein
MAAAFPGVETEVAHEKRDVNAFVPLASLDGSTGLEGDLQTG